MRFWKGWGWMLAFCFVTVFVYSQAVQSKQAMIDSCLLRCSEMDKELDDLLSTKEDLELHIASQSDPAWIEMVLIRDLGVVPEGWMKVHFRRPPIDTASKK